MKTLPAVAGCSTDEIAHHGVLHKDVNFLAKPYRPSNLAQRVRSVLDTPTA